MSDATLGHDDGRGVGGSEAVTATRDDFRALADSIPQLVWIAQSSGDIFWYNKQWIDYTGFSITEMQGRAWLKVHHPDHFERVLASYNSAFAAGEPWEDTFPLRRADGVFRWFLSRALPMRDDTGAVVRWFGTNTDITDQMEIEARLLRSEQRFRSLIDASSDAIWIASPEGGLVPPLPSWAAFTGQTEDAYRGWGWLDVVHPDDRAVASAIWDQAVATRSVYRAQYRMKRHDGAWRFVEACGVPVFDGDGSLREWVGTNTDITERKEAEHKLEAARAMAEEANRAKSQFIANMSHELRTPLSAVIGYSEMLGEELEDRGAADLVGDVQKIESSARHLLQLINDVLDLSKIEAGRMTISVVNFKISSLLDDVVTTVKPLIEKKGNQLELDVDPDLVEMRSDDLKIRQCLLNLLSNAAKFTDGGTIKLSARADMRGAVRWASFSIQDSGIGMAPDQLARLFQRFAQADESTTRQFGGTGLGLAITKAFSRKLGGDVSVTSEVGIGSTFTMALPADIDPEPIGDFAPLQARATAAGATNLVLVIDDDPSQRDLLSRFLTREGFGVETAADGEQGLALARRLRPKAILLDVEMPRMDGWSVLHAIRSDPDFSGTPVIMVSVVNEQSLGYALGATDYLTKPIQWDRLKHVLQRHHGAPEPGDVLLIDDDADGRTRIRSMLERDGWSVTEAGNGQDGLAILDATLPDLILLDLMMPVMDGFGFLHALRQREDGRAIPVVVLTAKDVTPEERNYLEHKADRVILKGSVKLTELAEALRRFSPAAADD